SHQGTDVIVQAYSTCDSLDCRVAPTQPYSPEGLGCGASFSSCDWGTRTTPYQQGPLIISFTFSSSVTHKLQMSFTDSIHTQLLVGDVGARLDGGNYGFYFQKQTPSSTATAPAETPTPTQVPSTATATATATPASGGPPPLSRQVVRQRYP